MTLVAMVLLYFNAAAQTEVRLDFSGSGYSGFTKTVGNETVIDVALCTSKIANPALKVPNPLYDKTIEECTISFDVKNYGNTAVLGALFSWYNADFQRMFFTNGGYLGVNYLGNYVDANLNNYSIANGFISNNAFTHVDLKFSSSGFFIYADNSLVVSPSSNYVNGSIVENSNYKYILDLLSKCEYLVFGTGSFWSDNTKEDGSYWDAQYSYLKNFTISYKTVSDENLALMTDEESWKRGSVHDPSITYATINGKKTYYVFGSHMGVAKTTDLKNWTAVYSEDENNSMWCDVNGNVCSYNNAFKTNKVTSVKDCNGNTVNWGNFDIPAYQGAVSNFTVKGNMWAPDIIYNPSMNKWCQYLSLNGDKWNSAIILLTADNIEGPYQYQGPVIFSGFNVTSNAATDYTKTDLQIAIGSQSSLPSRYNVGTNWGNIWPHAIDPGVFFDDNGDLWMNYGSWSGGIYIIKLNKNTGLRDYKTKYNVSGSGSAVTEDPYFGKKIAGGYYVSGEGSYIEKIGNYYYLFMSYGFYSATGGYEMRIFRSSNPDGPYTDYAGTSAIFSKYILNYGTTEHRGEKLIANYKWNTQNVAEIAQGHNSALFDEDGKAYVIYHTKFADGTEGHALRVHQLFVNQDGWITAAPHEYNSNTDKATVSGVDGTAYFSAKEIAGTYSMIFHDYVINYQDSAYKTPVSVTLSENGTISGDVTGTWTFGKDAAVSTTSYITLVINGTTYKGVVVPGAEDGTGFPVVGITAMSSSTGVNVWATKPTAANTLGKTQKEISSLIKDGANLYDDIYFSSPTSDGTTVTLSCDDETAVSPEGYVVTVRNQDKNVKITVNTTLSDGSQCSKTVNATVKAGGLSGGNYADGIVAYYNFENNLVNQYNTSQTGTTGCETNGTAPTFEDNSARGSKVLHQYFGFPGAESSSFTTLKNPLQGLTLEGATVSAWIKRLDGDAWDALWCFYNTSNNGRLYLTGNTYLGQNVDGYFDYNHPSAVTTSIIPEKEWALVTITFSKTGFNIYVNGEKAADNNSGVLNTNYGNIYTSVLQHLSSADALYLGKGSFWGSTPALFDDLIIWNRALSDMDVRRLYSGEITDENLANPPSNLTATIAWKGSSNIKQNTTAKWYMPVTNAHGAVVTNLPECFTAFYDAKRKWVWFEGQATIEPGAYTFTVYTTGPNTNVKMDKTINIYKTTQIGALTLTENQNGKTAVLDGNYSGDEVFSLSKDMEVQKVTLDRTFNTGVYSTIILPFDVTNINECGEFFSFKGIEYENNKYVAKVEKVSEVSANTPYIFKPSTANPEFTIGAATLKATPSSLNVENGNWSFIGAYEYKLWAEDSEKDYGFAGSTVSEDNIKAGEFVKVGSGVWINPFRCYLTYNGTDLENLSKKTVVLPENIEVRIVDKTESVVETPVSEIIPDENIKVWSFDKTVFIEAEAGTKYNIIDINGRLLRSSVTNSNREEVVLNKKTDGIIIVKISNKSFKIKY